MVNRTSLIELDPIGVLPNELQDPELIRHKQNFSFDFLIDRYSTFGKTQSGKGAGITLSIPSLVLKGSF